MSPESKPAQLRGHPPEQGAQAPRRGRGPSLTRRVERSVKTVLLPLAARLFPPRASAQPADLRLARRLLIVRQDNRLGNLVLISPFLQALRASAPDAEITIVTGDRFAELYEGCPWINGMIVERKRWLIRNPWAYPSYLAKIRTGSWDMTFEISNADTHSFNNALMTVVSGAPWRIGFDHERSRPALNMRVPAPQRPCHYSLAPLLLLSAVGSNPPVSPMRLSPTLIERACAMSAQDPRDPEIVIHAGGRGPKAWPPANFGNLIAELAGAGAGAIRVIGGPGEQGQLQEIAKPPGAKIVAEELRGLVALVSVLQRAKLYVGCDAGPLHVAAAAGVPTISIFLQSDPLRYAPLGEQHEAIVAGRGSRRWLERADRDAAVSDLHDSADFDPQFAARLYAMRPDCIELPLGTSPHDEVAFVTQRVLRALNAAS